MDSNGARSEIAERILEAAVDEFSEFGFAGARVDRIASHARVSPRSLYYHFGNKQDLYLAVHARLRAEHSTDFLQRLGTDSLLELLLANVKVAAQERWHKWARLMMWESLQPVGLPRDDEPINGDIPALRAAQHNGDVDPSLDVSMLALAFTAITFFPWIMPGEVRRTVGLSPTDPEFLRRQTELVNTLVARLSAVPARPSTTTA
jgi:TetR/AcrR family transcriptional regulator